MTDPQHGHGDRPPMPGGVYPATQQSEPPVAGWGMPPVPPGHGPGPAPSHPPPPTRNGRTGLIIAGVLGLVVMLALGVVIGIVLSGGDRSGESAGASDTASETRTYSMDAITNACDLVDPTPLTRWSPTPKGAPTHRETRPTAHSSGSLRCDAEYTSATVEKFSLNKAVMSVEAQFTNGTAPPFYDHWKHADVATPAPESDSGAVIGIGAQGYWYSEVRGDLVADMTYVVCVQDGNVSVRVRISLTREKDFPVVRRDELDSIARSQARRALDGLGEK
ncbi:hypothetical protein [Nocardia sputi]|uniref:hypothetical protein n=1 Tax=Nocardia sputi TaxID=2943705 RepID=UPI0020BE09D4|nr:hypothetical protein [Nocardia sputi]